MRTLILFFSLLKEKGYEGALVIGGETFVWNIPEVREIRKLVSEKGLEGDVIFPGYIPDNLLSRYYSGCDFFVFPSLYEGFGLPVLEAMQCGAPLLLSRSSSIPEVAGENAFYFEPESEESMLEAYSQAAGNPERVRENIRKGLLRSEQFTWAAAAEKILSLYNRKV